MENSDWVCLIGMQKRKKDNKLFLSFLMCKNRYTQPEIQFFNQPFDERLFNLVDDIMMEKPVGVISLASDFEDIDFDEYSNKSRGRKSVQIGNREPIVQERSIFDLQPMI